MRLFRYLPQRPRSPGSPSLIFIKNPLLNEYQIIGVLSNDNFLYTDDLC